jgi:hypothetical protein
VVGRDSGDQASVDRIDFEDEYEDTVAVLYRHERHRGDEVTLAALERRWQEVLELVAPQYPFGARGAS